MGIFDSLANSWERVKDTASTSVQSRLPFLGNGGGNDMSMYSSSNTFSANMVSSVKGANTVDGASTVEHNTAFTGAKTQNNGSNVYDSRNGTNVSSSGAVDYSKLITMMPYDARNGLAWQDEQSDIMQFQAPDWTYADWINERAMWQKTLYSPTGEQGWFYFKVFFNFNTQYGLLGGLLNNRSTEDVSGVMYSVNSAAKYLTTLKTNRRMNMGRLESSAMALSKFASILSFISTNAPWFFKSVKGLQATINDNTADDFAKKKYIEIECSPDAIDMRLTTLMDLYRTACYDEINQKEIIPENLRKFDMTIVLFQSPIKYLHTAMQSKSMGKRFHYKGMHPIRHGNDNAWGDVMSFRMFTFINCEFDRQSLGNMIPNDISNETPFQLGKGTLKIQYDRVYHHTMNEFMNIMFGDNGFYYGGDSGGVQAERYTAMQMSRTNSGYSGSRPADYKELVDASEAICGKGLMRMGIDALGNLAGTNELGINHKVNGNGVLEQEPSEWFKFKLQSLANKESATPPSTSNPTVKQLYSYYQSYHLKEIHIPSGYELNAYRHTPISSGVRSHYFNEKLKQMNDGTADPSNLVQNTNVEFNHRYDLRAGSWGTGNSEYGVGSAYWREKIKRLKDGIVDPK